MISNQLDKLLIESLHLKFFQNFLDKFFSRSRNLDYISQNLKQITLTTPANKIFEAINNFSEKSAATKIKKLIGEYKKASVAEDKA